ncbi:hypothetical protein P3S67_003717 [Capsicum chacoense]
MIDIGENKICGNIPQELGHLSSLEELYLGSNMLSVCLANFLQTWCIAFQIKGLYLGINQFCGTLPDSISNATKLNFLDLGRNMFSGNVPIDLGVNLQQIQSINLQRNHFTNDPSSTGELSFLISLSHCKFMKFLMIGDNQFRGTLPKSSLTNLSSSLERFIAYDCGIRGEIPVEIGNLTNLSWLTLGANELIGSIPQELGNLNKLQTLRMYENKLDGIIPQSLCNIKEMYFLDLRRNRLTGKVLGCLGNIYLDSNALSSIKWSFGIEIGNMRGLSELYLSGNELFGQIPSTIGQLQNLVNLSLDMNRLDGAIPKSFENLVSLEYLDLSHNNLSGQIPIGELSHKRFSYYETVKGTNNFEESNLIGKGSLGLVYKGTFTNGTVVAMKVFNAQVQAAFNRFDLEWKVLRNIRHRNLVKVIRSANLDFKALVLEYMPNGDLDYWLYSHKNFLDLIQRLKIMVDVACALKSNYIKATHLSWSIVT